MQTKETPRAEQDTTGLQDERQVAEPQAGRQVAEPDTAQRLRMVIGRGARLLRTTETGRAADLPPARVSVLLAVEHRGPLRLSQVVERERLNPTMLSRVVGHLVQDGLIVRSNDPDDRRSAWLTATDEGRELAQQIRAERTTAVQGALDRLTEGERASLAAALPALEAFNEVLCKETR
jgi:DNA-binding MarR family transcriptional regulator